MRALTLIITLIVVAGCTMTPPRSSPATVQSAVPSYDSFSELMTISFSALGLGDIDNSAGVQVSRVRSSVVAEVLSGADITLPRVFQDVVQGNPLTSTQYYLIGSGSLGPRFLYVLFDPEPYDLAFGALIIDLQDKFGGFDPTRGQVYSGYSNWDGGGCSGCVTYGGPGCPPCNSKPGDPYPKPPGRRLELELGETVSFRVPLLSSQRYREIVRASSCER